MTRPVTAWSRVDRGRLASAAARSLRWSSRPGQAQLAAAGYSGSSRRMGMRHLSIASCPSIRPSGASASVHQQAGPPPPREYREGQARPSRLSLWTRCKRGAFVTVIHLKPCLRPNPAVLFTSASTFGLLLLSSTSPTTLDHRIGICFRDTVVVSSTSPGGTWLDLQIRRLSFL